MSILSGFCKRKKEGIRILAMFCCRNEEIYLEITLTYLLDAGLEVAVIDNDYRSIREFMEAGPEEYDEVTSPGQDFSHLTGTLDEVQVKIIESIAGFWRKELGY